MKPFIAILLFAAAPLFAQSAPANVQNHPWVTTAQHAGPTVPLSATPAPPNAAPAGPVTLIQAGTLIDGASAEPLHNMIIVIRGNTIDQVFSAALKRPWPKADQVIDLSHATVLPGLIDTHCHIFLQGEAPNPHNSDVGGYDIQLLKDPIPYRTIRATISARRALEQGFTTIRDLETEGAGYGDLSVKRAVNEGLIPGPHIFGVGPAISTTGGYPLEGYRPGIEDIMPKGVKMIDGPVEARKTAREMLNNGVDWIKVYMTHRSWVGRDGKFYSQPTLTVDELKPIVDEAHGWHKKVACHVYGGIGMQRALDGGCDSIEHGLDLTDANIQQMLKQGTWYVPTLAVYYHDWAPENTPEGARDRMRASLHQVSFKKALAAGVKIAYGTDDGGFPWSQSEAQEFPYMVEFGMTPMQAIQAATSKAAELLDRAGEYGVIAHGANADVVATTGDPLKDIHALEHIGFVMKDGKVFKNEIK